MKLTKSVLPSLRESSSLGKWLFVGMLQKSGFKEKGAFVKPTPLGLTQQFLWNLAYSGGDAAVALLALRKAKVIQNRWTSSITHTVTVIGVYRCLACGHIMPQRWLIHRSLSFLPIHQRLHRATH